MNGPSSSSSGGKGPLVIAVLVMLLLVLHQDNWFWDDGRLVLGFMPIGMFWHVCLSVGAALTWWLATKIAWPDSSQPSTDAGAAGTEVDK